RRRKEASLAGSRARFSSLTTRELQVLVSVAAGKLNKQVGADLRISEVMVKVHRAHGMRKMHVTSLAELVRVINSVTDKGETARSSIQDGNSVEALRHGHWPLAAISATGSRWANRTKSR